MKIDKHHIEKIKLDFEQMQSKEDLLVLLNYTKPFIYGNKTVPFELKQLTYYTNPKRTKKAYTIFEVKKKSGTNRTINAPIKGLKALQKTLSLILQCVFEPHKAATGFVMGKSIVDNAKVHAGSNYVYNIDLKDFFSSIDQARVWKCLQLRPFNLTGELSYAQKVSLFITNKQYKATSLKRTETNDKGHQIGYNGVGEKFISFSNKIIIEPGSFVFAVRRNNDYYSIENVFKTNDELTVYLLNKITSKKHGKQILANLIASLCCVEMAVERKNETGAWKTVKQNVLPQGAPTSPMLSNVVCQRLDFLLTGVANRFGLRYTRYADDITFSSMHNVYQENGEFITELQRVIANQGFHIKESKTRLQKVGYRQQVTGLVVNENVNVTNRYIKQLRMWLYYWEKYGFEKASRFFKQQYISDKGYVKKGTPNMANVIGGKLDYLKMVKGTNNPMCLKLKERFERQVDKMSKLEGVLNVWETEGIEKAMEIYKTEIL